MTWIGTNRGKRIDFAKPDPREIDIYDLAQGLARCARYNGLTSHYYSVAEHLVRGSRIIHQDHALEFLLHDAPLAYMGHCPRPMKALLGPAWQDIHRSLWLVISNKFGVGKQRPDAVKRVSEIMLATEKRDLMPNGPRWPLRLPTPHHEVIVPWNANQAQAAWLKRLKELCGIRGQAVA